MGTVNNLEIITACQFSQLHLLPAFVEALQKHTCFPFLLRIIVAASVADVETVGEMNAQLQAAFPPPPPAPPKERPTLQNRERSRLQVTTTTKEAGYNLLVHDTLKESDSTYVLILPVSHLLQDKEWFGKMQLPLLQDRTCGLVGVIGNGEWNTRPPVKLLYDDKRSGTACLLPKSIHGMMVTFDPMGDDYVQQLSFAVRRCGMSAWVALSVRMLIVGETVTDDVG